MLYITRRVGDRIVLTGDPGEACIEVTVVGFQGGQVRLGIAAPAPVHIRRGELEPRPAADQVRDG